MINKLDKQTFTSEFESHWVSHSYGLVPHLSEMQTALLRMVTRVTESIYHNGNRYTSSTSKDISLI